MRITMNNITLPLAVLALALLVPALSHADRASTMRHLEYAAETQSLDIFVVNDSTARINARRCDYCELLTLNVTPQSVILMQGTRMTVRDAERLRNDGATVLFDPETLEVTRILLWHRPGNLN